MVLQNAADWRLQELAVKSKCPVWPAITVLPQSSRTRAPRVADKLEGLDRVFEGSKYGGAIDDLEAALVGEADLEALAHLRNRVVVQWILPPIFIGLWIIRCLGRCSG